MNNNVAFRFTSYHFPKAKIEFPLNRIGQTIDLSIKISPKGEFSKSTSTYKLFLSIVLTATKEDLSIDVADVDCVADFQFSEPINDIHDIPDFFYPNSIAIVFPYIRSFISTLSLQANTTPIILPTMNLTSLQDELKANTLSL